MHPRLALPLLLVLAAPALGQEDDFSKVQVKATSVAGSVSMLEGSGGNVSVLVGPDGVVLVDHGFAPLVPRVLAAVKQLSPKAVRIASRTAN